jgi:aquaporin Z
MTRISTHQVQPFHFDEERNLRRYAAEFPGTFWLVLGGCGSGVLAATLQQAGIGVQGVWLAFGLTLLTMACSIGHSPGRHLDPAVSIGLCAGRSLAARQLPPCIAAQVPGGVAAAVPYVIADGAPGFDVGGRIDRALVARAGTRA